MILLILTITFIVLCLLRIPVPFSLGLSSLFFIWFLEISPQQMVIQLYKGLAFFPLLAIPFFLLVGDLLNEARITQDLIRIAQSIVGRIKGGIAHVNILVSMVFGGISGSSTADTSAVGAVMIPAMEKAGYKRSFAAAITAASSTMGNIIPPSIYMIVYGAMVGVSIETLFIAGIIPGILIGVSQMIYSYLYASKHNIPKAEKVELSDGVKSFIKGIPALITVVLVIGGITFGFFTATESAVIAVVYTLLIVLFYYRTVKVKELPRIFFNTSKSVSAILFTIGTASIFGFLVSYLGGPEMIGEWLASMTTSPTLLLILISAILLILGTFLSEIATIIIFAPIFIEIQTISNIDPVLMGIVVIMSLCLGLVTPPYGMCLLIATQISRDRFTTVVRQTIPLIIIFCLVILLVIFFPSIALVLPGLFN